MTDNEKPLRDHGGWDMSLQFKPGQDEPSDAWAEADRQFAAGNLDLGDDRDERACFVAGAEWARAASAVTEQGEPSDAQEAVRRLKDSGVGAYMILAAVTKVYDMETKP